ncbi:hypothetical protein LRP50_16800 [Enterovibrio sp. ZSDZ42]|uniref:Uncharacterized protein n=1 Tax=Enterovibrio gelatinilyticus TaxID=2899819 RepID=A0ABT5R3F5_9GAMM|nr:hypothetical protein [Enterovibrio sp. ZSDZ42]MDD1794797.1 hypothetical protein [Enterovibrio sp. ZSDZ42]
MKIIEKGKTIYTSAILSLLNDAEGYIENIERTWRGDIPITGISLDAIPWFGQFSLSLRTSSDYPRNGLRYDSADWEHYDFVSSSTNPKVKEALEYMKYMYGDESRDKADSSHLHFIACAEALLDTSVASKLGSLGIKAPEVSDLPIKSSFEYVVTDPDSTISGNYCDFIVSNRVLSRLRNA